MSEREDRLIALAAAMADGSPVDWDAAEARAATESERLQVRRLRAVRDLADAQARAALPPDRSGRAYVSLLHPDAEGDDDGGPPAPVAWGPLRVIEKIGRGQFGDVYRAHDPRLDRDVALKLLRRESDGDGLGLAVVDEGRLLAKIRHPDVVTVFGAERMDGRVGVWMELVRGRTLEEELASRGPFPALEVVAIGIQMCRALDAVHRAGLVHRDVKAQNIMRDSDGRLVLMDFGTGRELDAGASVELAGTPLFMAPEVLAGQPATAASDLYSLGVVLYRLATGEFPVHGRTLAEMRAAHARGRVPSAAAIALPARLRAAIDRALEPSPASRFATAEEMEAGLARAAPERGTATPARSVLVGVIAAVVFLAIVGMASTWGRRWGGVPAGTAAPAANPGGAASGLIEHVIWAGPDTPSAAALSPDGQSIAYVEDTKGNLVLRDRVTGAERTLTDGDWNADVPTYAEQPAFSRDGRRIAYSWWVTTADDGYWQVRTIDLTGPGLQAPRVLYEYRDGWIGPNDWSPDGRRVAVTMRLQGTSRVGWIAVADGSMHIVAKADWRMSTTAAWSPDGAWMGYDAAPTERSAEPDVFLARADGSRVVPAVSGPGRDTIVGWTPSGDLLYLTEGRGIRQVWSLPMHDGAPAGAPALVHDALRGDVYAPSVFGAIDVVVTMHDQDIHVASVDFATGAPKKTTSQAISTAWPRNRQPKWSRDGRHFAYISSPQPRALSHRILSIHAVESDQPRILPLKLAQLWTYDWSPDNRWILARAQSFQGESGLYLISADTGDIRQLTLWSEDERQFAPQWDDDGGWFYYTKVIPQGRGGFARRHLATGREEILFRYADLRGPDGERLPANRDSTISPDRRHVVCYTTNPESVLWLIRVSERSVRELYRVKRPNAFVHNALVWTPDSRGVVVNQQDGPRGSGDSRELWYVPVDGAPRKLDVGVNNIRAEAIALHPDGSQVAFVAGELPTYCIVRLEQARPAEPSPAAPGR